MTDTGTASFEKVLSNFILNYKWYFSFVILICIAVSLQHYIYTPPIGSVDAQYNYTHYNNYLIFKQSFFHLKEHKDLFAYYPQEYYDLYKYTPTFALLMAPFAYLPVLPGLIIWNCINGLILFYAFIKFPFRSENKKIIAIAFILIEAITSLMISESNCLMAGLIILAYLSLEKKQIGLAVFLLMLSVFIKPFGLAAFSLLLFYPEKWKSFMYSILWFVVLFALPLIFISMRELIAQYTSWGLMIKTDHAISYGLSVMAWLHSWFGIDAKYYALFVGIILFTLPLFRFKFYSYQSFRQLFLSSILIWVVIFNHKAESPGFIIAVSGVALWYSQSSSRFNIVLIILCFLFTILSPTDLYPSYIKNYFFIPYTIKVVPCIIIWLKVLYDQLTIDFSQQMPTLPSDKNYVKS